MRLISQLTEFATNFLDDKHNYKTAKASNPSWDRLVKNLPKAIKASANLTDAYKIEGSIGKGAISEIPWICFFDKDITESAQNGFYIVLLFKADMSGYYLSLNQGWTQYENEYKVKEGKKSIIANANKAQSILRSVSGLITGPINLKARTDLGKGYELGNICATEYAIGSKTTDAQFLYDLHMLIGIYKELKGLVGKNILTISSVASEEDYQSESQVVIPKELPAGPIAKKDTKATSGSKTSFRDPSVAKLALEQANYQCIFGTDHLTFTSAATKKPFVEAHHIIPMEFQDQFEFSLDVPENIIALCPNCHRKIHQAVFTEKEALITLLHELRKDGLKSRGLEIELSALKNLYSKEIL